MFLKPSTQALEWSSRPWRDALCAFAFALLVGIVGSAPVPGHAAPASGWEIIDLGTLGGDSSSGLGVNGRGEVTGYSYRADGSSHAFVWSPITRRMLDLGNLLGGFGSTGQGINDLGQVVGTRSTADGRARAFVWDPATAAMIDLGTLGGNHSFGLAINNRGQVAGYSQTAAGTERGFVWDPDTRTMSDIGTLGAFMGRSFSRAFAINSLGQVTGVSTTARGERAFLWDPATRTMIDLSTLDFYPEGYSRGQGINDRGQVTGISVAGVGRYGAFLWESPGPMKALVDLGGNSSSANAINHRGLVAGSSARADGIGRAVLWDLAAGTITDLTALDGGSNFSVAAINDNGDLAGTGYTADGFARAVAWLRMTPLQRLQGIIARFDAGIADGTIRSARPSSRPSAGTATAFRNLLGHALADLRADRRHQACKKLGDAVRRADAAFAPPVTPRDWIVGPDVALVLDDLGTLHAALDCG